VTLPRLIVVTDRRLAASAGHDLLDVVGAAVGAGARAVLVREKDLPPADRSALVDAVAALLGNPGAPTRARGSQLPRSGAASVLVGAEAAGRSCHSIEELVEAREQGYDYATLSPVFPSPSKPGYGPALGAGGLRRAVAAVPGLPVVALGGVTAGNAAACVAAGAAGVAVMGAVMSAPDPAAVVREILVALGETVGA
jgi:thiamine-phosphate pyrophosphorylase